MGEIIRERAETSRRRAPEEIAFVEAERRSLATTGRAGLSNIAQGRIPREYPVGGGRAKKLDARDETGTSTSGASELQQKSYHPLAGSKPHCVTYWGKGREKSAEGKLTKQPEAAGTRIDDGETAESTEFEEDIGGGPRIIAHGGKSRGMPAGNIRQFRRYDKSDGTSRPDENIGMFKAFGLAGEGGAREERRWEIEKRYARRGYTRI